MTGFVPRVRAGSQEEHVQRSATLRVAPTDGDARWLLTIGPERPTTVSGNGAREGRADCTVRGRAEDLYLVLWKRRDADTLVVDGDRDVLGSFLGLVRI